MAKADKRVHIFERNGEFIADPASMELDPNQTFKIVNRTQEDLLFVVTNPLLFRVSEHPLLETISVTLKMPI